MHTSGWLRGMMMGCLFAYSPITSATEPTPLSKEECQTQFEMCACIESQCVPEFESKIFDLTEERIEELKKGAWEEGCPISLSDIQSVHLIYLREDGSVQRGELVVARKVASDVESIFRKLYETRFVIHKMNSIEHYGGNDDLSMADNNTSGLNCRNVKGTKKWSQHSYGVAIDINPLWNPYVRNNKVEPPQGKDYLDRTSVMPGLIKSDDLIIRLFREAGWKWGGHWRNSKDYQHFSLTGK